MKRLYSSSTDPGQGAVPRDFLTPEDCFNISMPPPLDPPGCATWPITSNNYGALPQAWADPVDYGALYNGFFESITFTVDPAWTDLWSQLTELQQNAIYESGCFCDGGGVTTPTLEVGPPQFPRVNTLPFFWVPPDISVFNTVTSVRDKNPVNRKPGTCCPDNSVGAMDMALEDGQLQAKLEMPKEPEQRFRSSYTNPDALLQNGFPRFCCVADECDPTKKVNRFIRFPRWLEDTYDPYDAVTPEEPVGAVPIVNDLNFDPILGRLCLPLSYMLFHDGLLHAVESNLPDHVSVEATPGEYDFQDPDRSGIELTYNKDWFGDDLIVINKLGDVCADQCTELGVTDCAAACDAAKYAGYAIAATHKSVAASEIAAIAASLAAAEADAPAHCNDAVVELCYSRRQTVAQGNQYEAETAIYCKVP